MRRNAVKIIGFIGIVLAVAAVALPIWLGFRTDRQNGLDHAPIAAVTSTDAIDGRRLLDYSDFLGVADSGVHQPRPTSPKRGDSALVIAVSKNNTDAVRLLLASGTADVNDEASDKDIRGIPIRCSLLALAVKQNSTEIVTLLLAHGATGVNDLVSVPAHYNEAGPSPEQHAGVFDRLTISSGNCPLLCAAAHNGNVAVVRDLIRRGANVNKADGTRETPLHEACMVDCVPVINILVDAGANIEAVDRNEDTPLMVAARYDQPKAVYTLLSLGSDPNPKTTKSTPLLSAMDPINFDYHIIQALLDAGASANRSDEYGSSPLMSVVTLLAEGFAGPDSSDAKEAFACFVLVLRLGARINGKDKTGATALMTAEDCAPLPIVQYLLDSGAWANQRSNAGHTALDIALLRKRPDVEWLLRTHGGIATGKPFDKNGGY